MSPSPFVRRVPSLLNQKTTSVSLIDNTAANPDVRAVERNAGWDRPLYE